MILNSKTETCQNSYDVFTLCEPKELDYRNKDDLVISVCTLIVKLTACT